MTKHTQEPWEIMPRENLPPRIKSKSFGIICRLNDILPTENGYQENEANANLIAAAPELLQALIEIYSEYRSLKDKCDMLQGNCTGNDDSAINLMRYVIAKAKGE